MRIIADRNMPFAKEAFETLGETRMRDGRAITPADVRDADALVIRSTTRVDAALLAGSRVRFVGTATIGTDHLDIPLLEARGIRWCFAPGCNANSVSEYVIAALLHLATTHGVPLAGQTIGIIGAGNVGTRVASLVAALGMRVLLNDPPRQRQALQDDPAAARTFVELDELLADARLVTLHVPMTRSGPDRTLHLADADFFARMRPGAIFINAARGAVTDTPALIQALRSGRIAHAVLDTWEGEPAFNRELLDLASIGTPHIAGHSFEGKVAGTVKVYQALCRFLGTPPAWTPEPLLPPPAVPRIEAGTAGRTPDAVLHDVVSRVYAIMTDDQRLRIPAEDRATHFDSLRKHYPVRREFRCSTVHLSPAEETLASTLRLLGFTVR